MGYAARSRSAGSTGLAVALALALAASLLIFVPVVAAAPSVVKNGRINACYKVKGKAKGTVRLVRGAKVRCPKGWKKVAWNVSGQAGAPGEQGAAGGPGSGGEAGSKGDTGAPGTAAKVASLESKVTELLGKVQSLESILAGVTNANLKEAIGTVPVVAALCGQAKKANEQSTALTEATGALNTVVKTLVPLFVPVAVPALPAFTCP